MTVFVDKTQGKQALHLGRLPYTIAFSRNEGESKVRYIDERSLPEELVFEECSDWNELVDAIKCLAVRGAPAIGFAGAASVALWAAREGLCFDDSDPWCAAFEGVCETVASARPTAVNLAREVGRVRTLALKGIDKGLAPHEIADELALFVQNLAVDDERVNRAIGAHGASLLRRNARILTHCNAGSLATVFYGTALGVVYAAAELGGVERVYADETRPVGQGARLTAWELSRVGIPVTLICDNMAASLMAKGEVDAVIVGADRITRNGDVANKIGTYGVAVLAKHHGIPFYVAAPLSTIDFALSSGESIPIEERDPHELASFIPEGVEVWNPAFDVTPAELVSAIITERGVYAPSEISSIELDSPHADD